MAYEQNVDSGSMFKNPYHVEGEDNKPGYAGSAKIGKWAIPYIERGEAIRLACWPKKRDNGEPWLPIKFSEPQQKAEAPAVATPPPEDDIPF